MILTTQQLIEQYHNLTDSKGRIARDVKNGKLFPVTRGLYETDSNTPACNLAQFIYGPSYISFDWVLSNHGLIPEAVFSITCATYGKNKAKRYSNIFGNYLYRDVPREVFSYGVSAVVLNEYAYHVATAEKALCDKLYIVRPVNSLKAFKRLLFEDLRIDEERLLNLDKTLIYDIAPLYKKKNLNLLVKYLKEER